MRVKILDDLETVTAVSALGREIGWYLVCDWCYREREPLVAFIMIPSEPPRFYGSCGRCFRKLSRTFAGQIM